MNPIATITGAFGAIRARGLQVSRVPGSEPSDPRLSRFKNQALAIGLQKLFKEDHFSICLLESLIAAAGVIPDGEVMRSLRVVHCVKWSDMPVDFRNEVQSLCIAMLSPEESTPCQSAAS